MLEQTIGKYLVNIGFKVTEVDSNFDKKFLLVLYVDDEHVVGDLKEFLVELKREFKIAHKDAKYFLGFQIQKLGKKPIQKRFQKNYTLKL